MNEVIYHINTKIEECERDAAYYAKTIEDYEEKKTTMQENLASIEKKIQEYHDCLILIQGHGAQRLS